MQGGHKTKLGDQANLKVQRTISRNAGRTENGAQQNALRCEKHVMVGVMMVMVMTDAAQR